MKPRKASAPKVVQKDPADVVRLAEVVTAGQRRFLAVGVSSGKELEPVGLLAGRKA